MLYIVAAKTAIEVLVMAALSLDIRRRIVEACKAGGQTRAQVATRFAVSLDFVKKILAQWRHTEDLSAGYTRCGRKPKLLKGHLKHLRVLARTQPSLTLEELRAALGVECALTVIHRALAKMGLTYKKRANAPVGRIGPTSRGRGSSASARAASRLVR